MPGRSVQDDDQAQRLYAELRQPLLRFFMRRVQDPADAEDLTQETFARLLRHPGDRAVADSRAFVFRVAINLLRDRARRLAVRNSATLLDLGSAPVDELTAEFVEDRDPERVLLGKEDVGRLVRVLGGLDERTRDIFILFRLEKMKQRDIAALYGISRSTIEKIIMRATLHLSLSFERDS